MEATGATHGDRKSTHSTAEAPEEGTPPEPPKSRALKVSEVASDVVPMVVSTPTTGSQAVAAGATSVTASTQALDDRGLSARPVAPALVVCLTKAEHIPSAGPESAKDIFATVTWGDSIAKTDKVKAAAAAVGWNVALDVASPSDGLDRAARMYPFLAIDIFTAELMGNSHRARLLVPVFALPEAEETGTWLLGPPLSVVASKDVAEFGHLDASITVSPDLLRAIATMSIATALSSEDAERLELLGQWNVQPSSTAKATVSIPGEEPSEVVIQDIEAEVSGLKHPVSLVLVSSQLLILDQEQAHGADLTMAIPRGCITAVEMRAIDATTQLCLKCKDFRVVTLHASSPDTVAPVRALHDRINQWAGQLGVERAALMPEAIKTWNNASIAVGGSQSLGWELDLSTEFDRQLGCSWQSELSEFRDGGNEDFSLCDTYPKLVLVPKRASAELASKCADFRSKRRLPCLSWYSPQGCIYRCSQPMTGVRSANSPDDEEFVGLLREIGTDGAGAGASKLLTIFDCRSHSAAAANSLKGAGLEDPSRYVGCERVFLEIGNIHAMRNSLDALMDLIVSDIQEFDDHESNWLPKLSSCGWLNHIRLLLGSALEVALVVRDGGHALVHCSDGWDRTSQVCALAQLLLDPYFR